MTKEEFDKLSKQDFENGAVLAKIRKSLPEVHKGIIRYCDICNFKQCPFPCPLEHQGTGAIQGRKMKITVRWWDGYIQVFENVEEWRAGAYLLWIRQKKTGGHDDIHQERHIPLNQVRWFSPNSTDREVLESKLK